ncbi:hypothetical protein PHYSODRAFT_331798 [Phytophthora sojae]|uniref:Uncharacterized protein n=1 Tax=Phytophthora sojae (strain P6497) TaxID=1094619 RepID=G4ZEA4_PHYSP|nr:hypothetical protein PHYSODRAFT_331798 [Phytophthora sojae]EGZ17867.1 hypothetical protein PHYSODRAFT_331798 [Phytophthora sojae]|eukprot:XP_009526925.1 hypothetical protein PHYSODRAFT_331798 [Phytophthora sojae]
MTVLQFTAEWDVNPADRAVGRIGRTAKIWTTGSSDPTDAANSTERAHFRTGRLTSKPAGSTTRARERAQRTNERTNGKRGVTQSHETSGRREWAYTRVARDGVTNGAQVVHSSRTPTGAVSGVLTLSARRTSDRISTVATNPKRVGLNTLHY